MLIVPEARTAILRTTCGGRSCFLRSEIYGARVLSLAKGKRADHATSYAESTFPQGTTVTATRTPGYRALNRKYRPPTKSI